MSVGSKALFRRSVFVGSAIAGSVAIVQGKAPAAQFELKCGCDLPADHPVSKQMVKMWATIEQETNGRVRTQYFANSTLGSDSAMLSQLREGALDFCWTYPAILGSVVPPADVGQLGFAFNSEDEAIRVMSNSPLSDFIRKEMAARNLIPLRSMWTTGMYAMITSARPIKTPEDMRGLKLRVSNGAIIVDLFKGLGASPVALASGETYTALQTKLVDGSQMGLISMDTFRLWEVQKYISLTNHIWSGFWVLAGGDMWKRLPSDVQETINRNHAQQCQINQAESKTLFQQVYAKMIQRGLAINAVDPVPFVKMLNPYYQKWSGVFGPTEWGILQAALGRKLLA